MKIKVIIQKFIFKLYNLIYILCIQNIRIIHVFRIFFKYGKFKKKIKRFFILNPE